VKALFVCSAKADHLTDAVEALEQLAGPGGDLHIFLKVLQLGAVRCRPPHNCYRPGARPPHRRLGIPKSIWAAPPIPRLSRSYNSMEFMSKFPFS
jgi:hypothetical protein